MQICKSGSNANKKIISDRDIKIEFFKEQKQKNEQTTTIKKQAQ